MQQRCGQAACSAHLQVLHSALQLGHVGLEHGDGLVGTAQQLLVRVALALGTLQAGLEAGVVGLQLGGQLGELCQGSRLLRAVVATDLGGCLKQSRNSRSLQIRSCADTRCTALTMQGACLRMEPC